MNQPILWEVARLLERGGEATGATLVSEGIESKGKEDVVSAISGIVKLNLVEYLLSRSTNFIILEYSIC